MFGITTRKTKQQKRRDVFVTRWNASCTPEEKMRTATDYLRTACKTMSADHMTRVAWDLFKFAARADGMEVELETVTRDSQ